MTACPPRTSVSAHRKVIQMLMRQIRPWLALGHCSSHLCFLRLCLKLEDKKVDINDNCSSPVHQRKPREINGSKNRGQETLEWNGNPRIVDVLYGWEVRKFLSNIQYNTIQYNTTQHNTTQHNTIQYNTIQHDKTIQPLLCPTVAKLYHFSVH